MASRTATLKRFAWWRACLPRTGGRPGGRAVPPPADVIPAGFQGWEPIPFDRKGSGSPCRTGCMDRAGPYMVDEPATAYDRASVTGFHLRLQWWRPCPAPAALMVRMMMTAPLRPPEPPPSHLSRTFTLHYPPSPRPVAVREEPVEGVVIPDGLCQERLYHPGPRYAVFAGYLVGRLPADTYRSGLDDIRGESAGAARLRRRHRWSINSGRVGGYLDKLKKQFGKVAVVVDGAAYHDVLGAYCDI